MTLHYQDYLDCFLLELAGKYLSKCQNKDCNLHFKQISAVKILGLNKMIHLMDLIMASNQFQFGL